MYKTKSLKAVVRAEHEAVMATSLLLVSLGVLLSCSSCAGSAGKEFALSFLTNKGHGGAEYQLFITASQENTEVTVSVPALKFEEKKTLKAGDACTVYLPKEVELHGSDKSHNTVRIEATASVSVTALNARDSTGETSVVYPIAEWGQEYFVFTPRFHADKEFSVTNGKDRNKIEIKAKGKIHFSTHTYNTGEVLELELQPYESVQFQSDCDLSGTSVVSEHPVAVFIGHGCFTKVIGCNHLFEQLLPVNRWGSDFIVPPVTVQEHYDSIYVQASQHTHIVVQDGQGKTDHSLSAGEMREIKTSKSEAVSIQADHGVQVHLLFNGITWQFLFFFVKYKAPFLMNVMPNDQFCSSFSLVPQKDFKNVALIVAQTSALSELRLDGHALPGNVQWRTVTETEFSWAEITYKYGSGHPTVSSSKTPFGLYSINLGKGIVYGSPAQCMEIAGGSTGQSGTCWAAGDPHYYTFDGRRFDFMGTCTYVMAKNCKDNGFPAFEVLAQNENRGSLRVSYVTLVTVKVYDITIIVSRSEKGRVRIDNILGSLPVSLNDNKLNMFYSGHSVVIEADFGLTVRYDWEHRLVVTLSDSFAGQTCGLCGNFNGDPKDDFTTPSGSEVQGAAAFGGSWKVPGLVKDAACRDDCVGGCDSCQHHQMKTWEGDTFCGILTVPNGPFGDCHDVIDPQTYMENCMFDVCMGDGLRHFLCRALETYADACQAAAVQIKDWRGHTKCTPQCPANSHYELCGSACPATCSDPNAPSTCKYPCVETCTCDSGFVLSGDKCVPANQCGCTYEGRYIPAGETISVDQGCQRFCECKAGTRQVTCYDKACGPGTKCQVVDGIKKCHPVSVSTCRALGDPHYTTFDNQRFDFQGTCVYQLVALCSENEELVPFEVRVQNNHRGSKRVSFTKLVEVRVYSLSIILTTTPTGQITVNDELVYLPTNLAGDQVSVYKSGCYVVVTTNFGLTVKFNRIAAVFVTLPSNYMTAVCGLCGNYNGKAHDDLIPKDGDHVVAPGDFGPSWRVAEIPGCVDGCEGTCPSCDIHHKLQYEKNDFCGIIKDPSGPFRDCHAAVTPTAYFEDCVYDVCLYNGRQSVLCEAITEYASACHAAGAKVYSWRTSQFCAPKCPANSHYEICATSCPATCKDLAPPPDCREECAEGCTCDDGYILSGDECVKFSNCGCIHNDRYYRIGQKFYPDGQCGVECMCMPNGQVACVAFKCGPNEECKVENGVWKCQPVGKGVCHATGDPHYRSFDGRRFDFQGTCTYTLSKSCGLDGTRLVPYAVVVENAQWERMRGRKVVAVTKMVAVEVYGFTITMKHKVSGVLVNGEFNYLPLNLNDGAVLIYQQGKHYVVVTDFGLRVTYNLIYHVTVTVPGNYREKVCGLCGNFNDDQKDDFQMPDKQVATNANNFGKSWKVDVPGVTCGDGCEGDSCPECDAARKAVFSETSYCGIIVAPKGPFSVCFSKLDPQSYFNDCVYDVCASNGEGDVLCDSLAAYAVDCHDAGVEVQNWRTASFCPMSCPANSHYAVCADPSSDPCPGLTDIVQSSSDTCREGCECDSGFLFNGQTCVPESQCGCYENGKTYQPGETVYGEDCSTKCTCDPAKGLECEQHTCPKSTKCMIKKGIRACYDTDPCKDVKCREKEKCHDEKGEAVCRPEYTGTCWAWGDPHYHTFDGLNFDFQGTCKYVISETCGNLDGLVPFSVTERNDNRGNRAVSFVREVDISVYGFNISVVKNQIGQVMVNGERLNLPLELGDDQVSVSQSGHTAVIETDFGLVVSYDWNWKLVLKLPSSYYGSVCGLCGNFNSDSSDELQNPAGKTVTSVTEWGKSWKVPEQDKEHPCADKCTENCPACDDSQIKIYESGTMCGALTMKTRGVFTACHAKVDPKPFRESCVYDVCLNKGDKKMLCQALASYAEQCEEEGIKIMGWRQIFGCPMNCQPHSHYNECASPCQPSCPFPEQPQICTRMCVEACVCDEGYVLSAGVCVPADTCGCSYQGRYYKPGQRFWADDACSRLCECDTTLGMVKCGPSSCSPKERCTTQDGERTCQPVSHATCSASGDPHYRTFDGHKFDFQGTCVYQLVGLCSQQPGLVPFKVTVQNDHRGSTAVSYTRTVVFSIYGVNITISREHPNKILLNGELTLLPLDHGDELSVYHSGLRAVVKTKAGITVTFNWRSAVRVTLPSNYQNAVCGLCGNYNENSKDDLMMPNGQAAADEAKLGQSWQVALTPGCTSGCQGAQCQTCTRSQRRKYQLQTRCGIIADEAGPFRECHDHVDPAPYLQDCVYDGCVYQGRQSTVCEAVEVYVAACQALGVNIYPWRNVSNCPMSCAAGSHYSLCATGCPTTCASLSTLLTCDAHCREACECDEGFLESGGTCVPVSDCGCSYNGQYFRKGDVFYPDDACGQKCVCGDNGAVSCQEAKCHPGEVCKVVNGVKACQSESQGKCVASGDPHYTSFDGRRFDFQGTCVYDLAKVCDDDDGRLTPFTVTQGNEKFGKGNVAVTESVSVTAYGFIINIQQRKPWKVMVDDELLNLPLSLGDGLITITQEGRNIVVRTEFGLTVRYDTVYYVEVIVPSTYKGKMCGLCGNYNDKADDDFTLPDGKQVTNVDEFGTAWVVHMVGFACGGCGGACPVCEEDKAAKYRAPDSCGIISAPNGPFKACHSLIDPAPYTSNCVFDVCAANGVLETLCDSVQGYVLACQGVGVKIQPWRNSSFCPAFCPEHSHYVACVDTCGGTCASFMTPSACSESCFEGCQCDDNLVSDGDQCVPLEQCGCLYDGKYLKVGESVMDKDCTSKCVCQPSGLLSCGQVSCASGQVCGVKDGARGCHDKESPCSVDQDGQLTSFDGWSGPTGVNGAFEVASVCDEKARMWFRVVADIRLCGKRRRRKSIIGTVYVFFRDRVITVNREYMTWENGRKISLPIKLTCSLSVRISGDTVVIERRSAVKVTYSLSQGVTVTIDSSLSGKMCGACGNFNHDVKDDMVTADGKATTDVSEVVASWDAEDFAKCPVP